MSTSVVSSVLLLKCSLVRSSVVQSSSATGSLGGSCECCEWLIPGRCSQQLNCYSRLYGQFACKLLPPLNYSSHWELKLSGKWPACNAIHTLHCWGIALAISIPRCRESCCHSQVYNCSTSSQDFLNSPLFLLQCDTVKQYTNSQINYEACLR